MNKQDSYTATAGIYRERQHIFVTHNPSGRQWVSKSPVEGPTGTAMLIASVEAGLYQFRPDRVVMSCDTRFWEPIESEPAPTPNSDFDSLCFIGD